MYKERKPVDRDDVLSAAKRVAARYGYQKATVFSPGESQIMEEIIDDLGLTGQSFLFLAKRRGLIDRSGVDAIRKLHEYLTDDCHYCIEDVILDMEDPHQLRGADLP